MKQGETRRLKPKPKQSKPSWLKRHKAREAKQTAHLEALTSPSVVSEAASEANEASTAPEPEAL